MDIFWETLQLIDRYKFSNEELQQLLALDLCKIRTDEVREYLDNAKAMFTHTELDTSAVIDDLKKSMKSLYDAPFD